MVDVMVLIISSSSFFLLIVGLILSVRAKGHSEILLSIKKLFLVLLSVSSIILWNFLGDMNTIDKLTVLLAHCVLFGAISFSYTLIVFGTSLTSLRIQFLLTLVAHGNGGASMKTLRQEYNKETVVRIRLHRLETSREIMKRGKYYMVQSRRSYFMMHSYLLLFLLRLYRPFGARK